MSRTLELKWSVSRGRDTYGYNICSLYVDRVKVSSCNGGGYDMQGTALGNWVERAFREELLTLTEPFYGLTFHDPNYDPAKVVIDGQTIEEREEAGLSLGLERYQAFHGASSKVPTERHVIPLIDGACGFGEVEKVLRAIGYRLEYVPTRGRNQSIYRLVKLEEVQQ